MDFEEYFYKLYPSFDLNFYISLYPELENDKYSIMYNYNNNNKIEGRIICENDFYKLYPSFDLNNYKLIFPHISFEDEKYLFMRYHSDVFNEEDFYKLYNDFDLELYRINNKLNNFPNIEVIYHYLYYKKDEKDESDSKKILHLVLYSNNEIYNEMYNITSEYYKKFNENVKTIYYKFDNDINEDYILKNDIFLIKGDETFIPGILNKTLKVFNYFLKDNYDYIIRSNISTIINIDLLLNYLNNTNISYGGGNKLSLRWICPKSGVIDRSLFNLNFFQGTCIILNNYLFNLLMKYENEIRKDIIDDLAICLLIQQKIINITMTRFNILNLISINEDYSLINNYKDNIIIYRNNHRENEENNKIDIDNMKYIIDLIG